jgi:hypothetical protein
VAARVSRASDASKGERKREGLGLVAAMVCFSTASKGSFYRHGRARELGFPGVAEAGNLSRRGGSAADARSRGRLDGVAVPPLALLAGLVTSATVGSRALWSVDREATVETFPPSTGWGPGYSNGRLTAGERGSVRRYGYGLGRTGTVSTTVVVPVPIFDHQVFGQMPARILNSKF